MLQVILGVYPQSKKAHCMYVLLSRVTSIEGLFLRQAITLEQAEDCKFSTEVVEEMRRLSLIESDPVQAALNLQTLMTDYSWRPPAQWSCVASADDTAA
jgi:hypothetical protein